MKTQLLLLCGAGLLAALTRAPAATHYADAASTNAVPPFTNWATAAANIQDAVDAAGAGDEIVVTNGVYQTGARAVNRVAVTKFVTVRSVNGPAVTSIVGSGPNGPAAVRCVYLTNGAVLAGFTLTNGAQSSGGGVWCLGPSAVVSNCVLTGNSAGTDGGGAYSGTLNNCTLTGNSASEGGGSSASTLNNCTLTGNTAHHGGGASASTLSNCTLTGNSAGYGGGAYESSLNNCLVYFNSARFGGTNYDADSTLNYSCTTPLPASGTGNLAEEPQLASSFHLSAVSPCIGRGSATFASGLDLDGEPWANPPSIGCDEYWSGSVTGAVGVAVVAAYTNVGVGLALDFQALIDGRVSASRWDFGDGVVVSNRPWASHAWAAPGDYVVELRAYNESEPAGVAATVTVYVGLHELYVALSNGNPVPPYTNWATAATNIQDALDAAGPGALVWVSNGVYATGGRASSGTSLTNRVCLDRAVTLRSVNGPESTLIHGMGSGRCAYLANGAVLTGFTLTNGVAQIDGGLYEDQSGGGVWCEGIGAVLSNCVVAGCSASWTGGGARSGTLINCTLTGNSATYGGGADGSTLNNCVLTGNSAMTGGGGAHVSTLTHCTLTGNYADSFGGGASDATLDDCVLMNNSASDGGGGANSSRLTNCTLTGNAADSAWSSQTSGGGAYGSTLENCTLQGNWADSGGGARDCTLNNCVLTGNGTGEGGGGGALWSTLNNCTLIGNHSSAGGGATGSTLTNCILSGNSAYEDGGGAFVSTLYNCTLTGNWGSDYGGGAFVCTLYNCTMTGNQASYYGGGASRCTLNNCTVTGNSAGRDDGGGGGGVSDSTLNNCIVYYNTSYTTGANYLGGTFNYSCTTPLPADGAGNISTEPQLAGTSHLGAASPCRGAGSAAYTSGVDLDGDPWANPPSIGCDEYWSGSVTGALNVAFVATYTSVAPGIAVDFQAVIGGRVSASRWDLGDGLVVSNRLSVSHAWAARGDYVVELRAYNETYPSGVATSVVVRVVEGMHYVSVTSTNPVAPYTNWATAAARIQDAVDVAVPGARVLVSDGVYQTGTTSVGEGVNRVAVLRPVTVQSVHGPGTTIIDGAAAMRCVYLAKGAVLAGFTLTNGAAQWGGGVWCESATTVVSNCTLVDNSVSYYGGGAYSGLLNNCTLTGNSAGGTYGSGGGASEAALNHCTLIGNSAAQYGGGASWSTLDNCIVYYNSAPSGPNHSASTMSYSCTTPLSGGTGNISDDPQLPGNWHLSATSPCRGAGNAASTSGTDLDGEPWANPPSIGCDEYSSGSATGALSAAIVATNTFVTTGIAVDFQALIGGRAGASRWDFGDGTVVSNRLQVSHAWATAGDHMVELRAYNETYPAGVAASVTVRVVEGVHYVSVASTNPVPPYTNWATAATRIQDAVDAAVMPGARVLVTNGVYQSGATAVHGMSNRVAVTRPVLVQSVNGPAHTSIAGYRHPGTANGPTAIRCAYLTNGAMLVGFTLTDGATQTSGDSSTNQSGGGVWCESASAVVSNCTLTGNVAARYGGGANYGTLNHCTLTGNAASAYGGGARECTLNNCTLTGNITSLGGGASGGVLNHCILTGNSADSGGGTYASRLNHCILTDNSAQEGGGAIYSRLNHCTLTGNSAAYGGGATDSLLTNCIVYHNNASATGSNHFRGSLDYSCTTPLPTNGTGNISDEPQLAGNWHLSAGSPCRGAGSAASTSGVDLDGEPWANPPSIGCDEPWSGSVTGALSVAILAANTHVTPGFAVGFQAAIGGRVSASWWDFGDGTVVSNRLDALRSWAALGDYVVELRAYNETYPEGLAARVTVRVSATPVHYVSVASTNAVPPYTNWATAATRIQDAVDAAVPSAVILVSNGVYQTGARAVYGMSNRLALTKSVTVQSVNGPAYTSIVGYQEPGTTNGPSAIRCAYLTNGAVLAGFTLTNGATQTSGDLLKNKSGGGVWCEPASAVVSNCTLTGNSAAHGGGGAYYGTLNNCTLTGNSTYFGGGASGATLYHCTLTGNSAVRTGGGAYFGTLNNCIVYYNSARRNSNYFITYFSGTMNYSCTTPDTESGVGNITNAPLFVDTNGWSNLRLQSNSPCINAGNNAYVTATTDLDSLPRIAGGTVDIGAYEFQFPASTISYAWLQQFGLPTDGSADYVDTDHDCHNNWQEWMAGTDPTNALSVLRLALPVITPTNVTLTWTSVINRTYTLEQATNLGGAPAFSVLRSNLVGLPGTTSWTDTNAPVSSPRFYHLRVSP